MTVKDILKLVCDFVGETEIEKKLENNSAFTSAEQEKVDKMLRCVNRIVQEIACDYIPLMCKEDIDADKILTFSSLSKNIHQIYEVRNRFGIPMKFKLFNGYAEICGKAKSVVYSYLPAEASEISSQIETNVQSRVVAYGVASEYLQIDGVPEDAQYWEDKFKDSLFMLSRKHGEHLLPKRSWF